MRSMRGRSRARRGGDGGSQWLSFSDLMSSVLLIFILILFYIMYRYWDMAETTERELALRQNKIDQQEQSLEQQSAKLTEQEQLMIAQQIKLDAARADLESAEAILANQEAQLNQARSLLDEKEDEIAAKEEQLDALSVQLGQQQTTIDDQMNALSQARSLLDEQADELSAKQQQLDSQSIQLGQQQSTITSQQLTLQQQQEQLEDQQRQIEQLVGMKARIIASLSEAFRNADIKAKVDIATGAITLKSDVLFDTGKYELSERGKDSIDQFLGIYLDVLFSDEYRPYVSEVIIEGHTDSQGTYIENLKLSQQRALAVASYVLADNYTGISGGQREHLRKLVTVNGRSFSDPVPNAFGYEDMDASRRVMFKFRLTDERMIEQLKGILEEDDIG